jgi:soluble lytic murein transglycosylase-like protein
MSNRARMAEKLSIEQLQQSIQDGVLPSYIGVPLLKSKVEDAKLLQAAKAAQSMGQQPSVTQQIMSQAQQVGQPEPQMQQADQGVPSLQSNLPASMAGGGIVAFAEGGMYDEEDSDEDRQDAARQAEMDEMMDEYAQSFQSGIGQLPAAQSAAQPQSREGIASGDAADFVARIMHKESRGQRYGKDGQLLTSEKGAQGEMQVMPGTSRDPGYGVKAARDDSPDEKARVGRDYANTLLERYGDPKLAAIAYNMGPGATDKWLAAGADISKLPKETQGYVKGFAGGGEVQHFAKGDLVFNPETGAMEEDIEREGLGTRLGRAMGYGTGADVGKDLPGMAKAKENLAATLAVRNAASAPKAEAKPVIAAPVDSNEGLSQDAGLNARIDRMLAPAPAAAASEPAAGPVSEKPLSKLEQYQEALTKDIGRREENIGKQREQDKYMAMLSAGLGMMGGTSQHALANIGAGGQQGIQSLMASNKDRTAEENALLSGKLGLLKLGSSAEQASEMRKLRGDMQQNVLTQRAEQTKASNALGQSRLAETHSANTDRQMQAMEALAINNATKNMGTAYTEDAKEKIKVEALTGLYSNPRYRKMFMERNDGLDPLTMLTKSGTQAQSGGNEPGFIKDILNRYPSKG